MPNFSKDPNFIDLSQYKGPVSRCNQCNVEQRMSGRSCTRCLDRGFVAKCLACDGKGLRTMGSVWDGGQSQYTSPCGICGGKGVFPASKPKDWVDEITVDVTDSVHDPAQVVDESKVTV